MKNANFTLILALMMFCAAPAFAGSTTATTAAAGGTSLIIKAPSSTTNGSGYLKAAYATNLTSTAAFLIVVDSPTVPGTGTLTVTVLDCVALPANSTAAITGSTLKQYVTGITALISSASSCATFTTGTVTAFITGDAN